MAELATGIWIGGAIGVPLGILLASLLHAAGDR